MLNALLALYSLGPLMGGNLDPAKPNVLILYYDDFGYSDYGANDSTQTSLTPQLDSLAQDGMSFSAGHSADGVCSPSRYAILTGRYAWRTTLKANALQGYTRPLMADSRFTVGEMFQDLGYHTSMVGKWHIGMQFYSPSGNTVNLGNDPDVLGNSPRITTDDKIDFSTPLTGTPTSHGFDYYFGTAASLDMPPYLWIENQTALFKGGMVVNGQVDFSQAVPATNSILLEGSPVGAHPNDPITPRLGAYDPNFNLSDYLQIQTEKVREILAARSADSEPFFMYIPFPAPHKPWAVQAAFDGSTPYLYGDYLAQMDHYAGEILGALEDPNSDGNLGDSLAGNTVVFMSSDNGPENHAQGDSVAIGRDSNGSFRGMKRDSWEGGTRVPFVVRWPEKVAAGSSTSHACWQGDFIATMAEYLGYDLEPEQAPDAESFLPVLLGNPMPTARREGFIQHSSAGQFSVIEKNGVWKLIDGTGSGGFGTNYSSTNALLTGVFGTVRGTPRQLFNLTTDSGEDNNLLLSPSAADTAKEAELYALLNEIRGNTTTGTEGNSNVPPVDTDQDGIPNYHENAVDGLDRNDPTDAAQDLEPDGLNNLEEFLNETDINNADSDNDSLEDGLEVSQYGSDPNNSHSDSDSLPDGDEALIWNTNPILADTDGDGINDDVELAGFSNPRDACSIAGTGSTVMVALDPATALLVGVNGTANDTANFGAEQWTEAGSLYVRERTNNSNLQRRTRLFLQFDLSSLQGQVTDAKLRIHQRHRLNADTNGTLSDDLVFAAVTQDWGSTAGSFPLFDQPTHTPIVFGRNDDFGTAADASGFFGGSDAGFDPAGEITTLVHEWQNGNTDNHGIRIGFSNEAFTGSSFSTEDDPATSASENLQLLVTTQTSPGNDQDGDFLADDYELAVFGDLDESGTGDSDGDQVNNLLEQAFGSDPLQTGSVPLFEVSETMEFSFHQRVNSGLGYAVQVSEDLETWHPFTQFLEYANPARASTLGAEYNKVSLAPISTLPPRLFYRVGVWTYTAE